MPAFDPQADDDDDDDDDHSSDAVARPASDYADGDSPESASDEMSTVRLRDFAR